MSMLVSLLGWVPVVGPALQVGEVAKRAYEAAKNIQIPADKAAANAGRMNEYLTEVSTQAFDEHLKPYVDELGLPDFLVEKARDKSVGIIAGELEKRYTKRTT